MKLLYQSEHLYTSGTPSRAWRDDSTNLAASLAMGNNLDQILHYVDMDVKGASWVVLVCLGTSANQDGQPGGDT